MARRMIALLIESQSKQDRTRFMKAFILDRYKKSGALRLGKCQTQSHATMACW